MVDTTNYATDRVQVSDSALVEPTHTVISWSAIIGGAVAATALSLILLTLGSALGLTFTPALHDGTVSKTHALAVGAIIWIIIMQWISSGFGGYLAGRLRTRWVRIHEDECYFRDTAHGFIAWAVATLFTVGLIASGSSSILHGGMHAAAVAGNEMPAGPAHGMPPAVGLQGPFAYYVDSLFRNSNAKTVMPEVKMEANRILLTDLKNGGVNPEDKTYLAQLVSTNTGISQADANTRVNNVLAQIKDMENKAAAQADDARKSAAAIAFFTFLSLLIGAFIASVAGAVGGHYRNFY